MCLFMAVIYVQPIGLAITLLKALDEIIFRSYPFMT